MPALTLLVPVRDPGSELDDLVTSIDAQVAPRDAFDVVFVDGGSSDGSLDRLQRLAAARPNVTFLPAPAGLDEVGLVQSGLEHAGGDLVAVVRPGQRLTPQAVALVAAAAGGSDAVLGRGSSTPDGDGLPLDDGPVAPGSRSSDGGLLAVRRTVLDTASDAAATLLGAAALDEGWPVVGLGSVACLGRRWPEGGPVREGRLRWEGTELAVEVDLDPAETGATAWLVLARADASEEIAVPAQVGGGHDGLVASASVDLAPESRQGDGVWHVRLRVRSHDDDRTVAVTAAAAQAAVLQGRQVVPESTPAGVTLDVGATRSSLVGRVPMGDASLTETARGARLVLGCPSVHVVGSSSTPVAVLLGRFRLPAVLVCEAGAARVEAWASGLAGRSRISVQTGGGTPRRTGLDLRIAGTGEMTLARTPRKPQPAVPAPTLPAPATSGLRSLRRRVPSSLEPVVRRLAQVGPLREAYRKVTSR